MIKFTAAIKDGGILLGLGLSAENVKRLQERKPIDIDLSKIPGVPWKGSIVIMYGVTEESLMEELKPLINEGTNFIDLKNK